MLAALTARAPGRFVGLELLLLLWRQKRRKLGREGHARRLHTLLVRVGGFGGFADENLRLVGLCLSIWFLVSFGFGILLLDVMNQFQIAGVRLGFWFAQQGSIYVFVLLIFFYAWRMSLVDEAHGVSED